MYSCHIYILILFKEADEMKRWYDSYGGIWHYYGNYENMCCFIAKYRRVYFLSLNMSLWLNRPNIRFTYFLERKTKIEEKSPFHQPEVKTTLGNYLLYFSCTIESFIFLALGGRLWKKLLKTRNKLVHEHLCSFWWLSNWQHKIGKYVQIWQIVMFI